MFLLVDLPPFSRLKTQIFASVPPSFTTERQKLRPFVSKYPPRFPTLKTVFRSIRRRHIHTHNPCETLLLQSRNPISTNYLAHLAVSKMSIVLRQKLFFEPAKIHIISHTTKQLRIFSVESWERLGTIGVIGFRTKKSPQLQNRQWWWKFCARQSPPNTSKSSMMRLFLCQARR